MLQAALASLMIVIGTFEDVIACFIFVTVAFLGLTVAGLFILHRRQPRASSLRTPGYPGTPAVSMALVLLLLLLLAAHTRFRPFSVSSSRCLARQCATLFHEAGGVEEDRPSDHFRACKAISYRLSVYRYRRTASPRVPDAS